MADHREAMKQGQAQLDSIKEMVAELQRTQADDFEPSDDDLHRHAAFERAERAIHEDALSVEVRSGWCAVDDDRGNPEEYRILLCTGGPACQIVGKLNEHGEPETASMQVQDWGIPWMTMHLKREDEEAMLAYARCFYFGEG